MWNLDNMAKEDSAENDTSPKAATIDEALEQTHFGKFNIKIILFSGLILNNVVLECVGVSFALPVVACDLDLSYQQQGILGAVCFLGIIVSSHFWGLLADTRGRKRTMRPALILGFLITLISSFSINFNMMVVLRFFNGIFLSAGSAIIFAYLGEFHSQLHRNKAILFGALISAFGAIFFPIIAWVFINQEWSLAIPYLGIVYKPWRLYFVMCGISGFSCGIYMRFLPESPKYLLGVGRAQEALEVLQLIHKTNTQGHRKLKGDQFRVNVILPDLDTPIRKLSTQSCERTSASTLLKVIWHQTAPLFMRQHIRKTLLAAAIQFITFFSAHGVYMWFPYLLNNIMLYTDNFKEPKTMCEILSFTQSANFSLTEETQKICVTKLEISTYKHTIGLELIYVTFLLIVIYANRKFERTPILFTILAICGLCGIVSLIIKIPLVAIYLFVVLLCCGLATSVLNTIVVDVYPTNLRAMAVCISLMVGRIGSVTGSNVLGALLESHCEVALYSSATSLVVAAFLGILMPKPKPSQRKPNAIEEGNK